MSAGPSFNFATGLTMGVVGLLAALLQAWLWTFPMVPDPTGTDPNGVTTAPKFWRYTHRLLGYIFVALYVVLLSQMVPRTWRFEPAAWTLPAVVHAVLGISILPVLIFKVGILRRWQKHGKKLPLLGALLLILSVGALAIVAPALRTVKGGDRDGAGLVAERCFSCHGASRIISEDGDFRDWLKTLEDMTENAEELRRPDPVGGDAVRLAEYLESIRPDD